MDAHPTPSIPVHIFQASTAFEVPVPEWLREAGYAVEVFQQTEALRERLQDTPPDLCIVELGPSCGAALVAAKAALPRERVLCLASDARTAGACPEADGLTCVILPVQRDNLLKLVRQQARGGHASKIFELKFPGFREFLARYEKQHNRQLPRASDPKRLFEILLDEGIYTASMAREVAEFLDLTFVSSLPLHEVCFDLVSERFCANHGVVPYKSPAGARSFAVRNPFDLPLLQLLATKADFRCSFLVSHPRSIDNFLRSLAGEAPLPEPEVDTFARPDDADDSGSMEIPQDALISARDDEEVVDCSQVTIDDGGHVHPVVALTNRILLLAVQSRASDIHFEPKEDCLVVRVRVDGEMRKLIEQDRRAGRMVISRLKSIASLDIAEKRKPQDGSFLARIDGRRFQARLATTSTPNGESMIIRLLESASKPKTLLDLGMTEAQAARAIEAANRHSGLILLVGPTGSGKTSTIYSLLHSVDFVSRSLMSVEDPVEYRIPFANQQEVNEKAGVTFEALLRSALRQDPDVLYFGEIRDPFSAKTAVDIVSTGHLCITTLHAPNTTAIVTRLERLGVARGLIAESCSLVISQRLVRTPCTSCCTLRPPSADETRVLARFTAVLPAQVVAPVGCSSCGSSGYHGRMAVYEFLGFDPEIQTRVRAGASILELRRFMFERGDDLFITTALEKIREHKVSAEEMIAKVLINEEPLGLVEETQAGRAGQVEASSSDALQLAAVEGTALSSPQSGVLQPPAPSSPPPAISERPAPVADAPAPSTESTSGKNPPHILVVDDDTIFREYVKLMLQLEGHQVTTAGDGVEALMELGQTEFDLVICDLQMPNIGGFALAEFAHKKKVDVPILFTTASDSPEDEVKGLELGAADFIRKPLNKAAFLLRVNKVLRRIGK